MDAVSVSSTISHLKKRIEELTNVHANTKILMYMVIHDLKHPTESLIENVNCVMQQLHCTYTQLANGLCEINEIKAQLKLFANCISEQDLN